MILENLLAIHTAHARRRRVQPRRRQPGRLSPENRFDAAYEAILQCAMVGPFANGYHTATSQPDHHQTRSF
jgi:hypothetical protein